MLKSKRYWFVLIAVLGAVLLYRNRRHPSLEWIYANVRAFDLPSAGMYDALFASLLSGFYTRVADEVAEACPSGKVLEVGSGLVGSPCVWYSPLPACR